MRLKVLSVAVGATLVVAGIATAPESQASELPVASNIIGGSTVPAGGAPWAAQVSVSGAFCSGSVIGDVWVLTASHCGKGGNVKVGSQQLGQGRTIQVVADYNDGDVALKKLASSAGVPALPVATTAPPVGATVQIYGWGGISDGGPLAQSIKTANLRVVRIGGTIDGAPINGQAFHGDSGGPMVYNGQVIGTCTGPVDSNPDPAKLTVGYQNIPQRSAWIRQITGIGGSNPPPPPPPADGTWRPWVAYTTGTRVTYGGRAYVCLQAHTSQPGWEPSNVPALWKAS